MNPYLVLNLPETADDAAVRTAYLECVRRWPPERDPQRFREIADAYEKIKNEYSRLDHLILNKTTTMTRPLDAVLAAFRYAPARTPPSFELLKEHLKSCLTRNDR